MSYSEVGISQQQNQLTMNYGPVLEEELQEKGAMFRDFLTSRVRIRFLFCLLNRLINLFIGYLGRRKGIYHFS